MCEAEGYRAALDAGKVPDGPAPPEMLPGLDWWFDAFFELSTDRQIGMGMGPIPAASITRFTAGWADEDAEAFRLAMRRMDGVFIEVKGPGAKDKGPVSTDPNAARDAFRAMARRG